MSRETDFLSFPLQREWKQTLSFKSWQSYVAEGSSSFVEANTLPASTDWSPAGSKSFCCGFTKTLALCCSADHQHQIDVWLLGRRSWPWSTRGCYAGCKCIIQELPAWKNTSLPPFWPGLREPGGTGVCFVTWKAAMAFQSNITTEYLLALSNEMPKSTNRKWSRKFFFFFPLSFSHCEWERRDTILHVTAKEFVLHKQMKKYSLLHPSWKWGSQKKDSTGIPHGWGGGSNISPSLKKHFWVAHKQPRHIHSFKKIDTRVTWCALSY